MGTVIVVYLIFAITTAITCHLFLFSPVLERLKRELAAKGTSDPVIEYSFLMRGVLFLYAFVAAPVMIVVLMFDSFSESFRNSLYSGLSGEI